MGESVAPLIDLLGARQNDLADRGSKQPDVGAIVDALANRLGEGRPYRMEPQSSAMPERTIALVPALAPRSGRRWTGDLPRPGRLIEPPEMVDVIAMLPDHPPAMFVWRRKRYRVIEAERRVRIEGFGLHGRQDDAHGEAAQATRVGRAYAMICVIAVPAASGKPAYSFSSLAIVPATPHHQVMVTSGTLKIGDRVRLSGGYSFEPVWLAGRDHVDGSVIDFIPGQNDPADAVVKLDEAISYQDVTGELVVLQLRYVGATWSASETVHVELCDFAPEATPWKDRRKGKWAESHATYTLLVA